MKRGRESMSMIEKERECGRETNGRRTIHQWLSSQCWGAASLYQNTDSVTMCVCVCVCVCVCLRGEAAHQSSGSDIVIECCSVVILTLLSELGIIVSVIQEPNLDPEARTVMGLLTPVSFPQPGDRTQGALWITASAELQWTSQL